MQYAAQSSPLDANEGCDTFRCDATHFISSSFTLAGLSEAGGTITLMATCMVHPRKGHKQLGPGLYFKSVPTM